MLIVRYILDVFNIQVVILFLNGHLTQVGITSWTPHVHAFPGHYQRS